MEWTMYISCVICIIALLPVDVNGLGNIMNNEKAPPHFHDKVLESQTALEAFLILWVRSLVIAKIFYRKIN